jgi:Phage integrase family
MPDRRNSCSASRARVSTSIPSRQAGGSLRRRGLVNLRFHDTRHTFATRLRANGVHEWDIRDLLGHTSVRMTSVYTHQTPVNLCHAVNTLGWSKPAKVVRFKLRSVSGLSNPSATADGTDLMIRRSRVAKTHNARSRCALIAGEDARAPSIAPSSRHRAVERLSAQQSDAVNVRQLAS